MRCAWQQLNVSRSSRQTLRLRLRLRLWLWPRLRLRLRRLDRLAKTAPPPPQFRAAAAIEWRQ